MIRNGATLAQLINETGRSATFIRSVISQIRNRGIQIDVTSNEKAYGDCLNATYKIGSI